MTTKLKKIINDIREIFKLYAGEDGTLNKDEIVNMVQRELPGLDKMLGGQGALAKKIQDEMVDQLLKQVEGALKGELKDKVEGAKDRLNPETLRVDFNEFVLVLAAAIILQNKNQ